MDFGVLGREYVTLEIYFFVNSTSLFKVRNMHHRFLQLFIDSNSGSQLLGFFDGSNTFPKKILMSSGLSPLKRLPKMPSILVSNIYIFSSRIYVAEVRQAEQDLKIVSSTMEAF